MSAFVALFVIILCTNYAENIGMMGKKVKIYHRTNENYYPWIGLLRVNTENAELVTGAVLIEYGVAIANANDISRIDKKVLRDSVKVTFFEKNTPWDCNVSNYLLHPEFEKRTINTIAIVYLDCDRKGIPINWPKLKQFQTNIFAVGFTDQSQSLEQIRHQMFPVNSSVCIEFYIREELDLKHIWPCNFLCAKATLTRNQCVFDAGMALVANNKGIPILIGLSIYGPGCSLPSRYIEFFPYIPWIKSHIKIPKATRRSGNKNIVKQIDPSSDIVSDSFFIEDDFYVTKLNATTMVLERANASIREAVHGDCLNNEGIMMYREAGLIRARGRGIGVYALSLYDLFYNQITCVMVSVKCKRRTLTKFWFERGFNKDDYSDLIKVVPFPKRGEPVPSKILFLKHYYNNYDNIMTANIVFKFEFENEAEINIDFFGTLKVKEKSRTTSQDHLIDDN